MDEKDAQIDLLSRKAAEGAGIQGHAGLVADVAKAVIKTLPKWHILARCNECDITEECVIISYDDEQFIRNFYEQSYSRGHPHPITVTMEKVGAATPTYTMRRIDKPL